MGHWAAKEGMGMCVQVVPLPSCVTLPALQGPQSPFTDALFNATVKHGCCQNHCLSPHFLASCAVIGCGAQSPGLAPCLSLLGSHSGLSDLSADTVHSAETAGGSPLTWKGSSLAAAQCDPRLWLVWR